MGARLGGQRLQLLGVLDLRVEAQACFAPHDDLGAASSGGARLFDVTRVPLLPVVVAVDAGLHGGDTDGPGLGSAHHGEPGADPCREHGGNDPRGHDGLAAPRPTEHGEHKARDSEVDDEDQQLQPGDPEDADRLEEDGVTVEGVGVVAPRPSQRF